MTMDGNAAGAPRFAVGTVISTSLSVLFANVWSFLLIILAVGLPAAVLIGGSVAVMAGASRGTGVEGGIDLAGGGATQVLFLIFIAILAVLAYLLIQAAVTYGALQSLRGRKAGIGACISSGLAALPRVFLAGLIFSVTMGIVGFILARLIGELLAGGGVATGILAGLVMAAFFIFVVILFWVFIPAIVVERDGPIDCFARSLALTKGRRWAIFGILALVFVANWVISLLGQFLGEIAPIASGVINLVAGLFFMALSAVLAAVGYYYLRAEKEGIAIDDVVAVFD
ncbi:hypothetical protein [Dongia sedimenti]|uniref:DUF7847 domain-containing protein n=1 Tax=Dongia sedimenti TaxID=3064282 RepID=A0ABU0YSG5_9PROT|nr:hypothetical protein [Rhodospirillaceae bacterium R-7]